jgi:hypothetical protein
MKMGGTFSRGLALVAVFCLAPGACSSQGNAPVARFQLSGDTLPNLLDVPFPSDAYLANGKVVDPLPGLDAFAARNAQYMTHEVGKLNGFGLTEPAFFYVDDPTKPLDDTGHAGAADIDSASLPLNEDACVKDTSSVFLIDLAETDPTKARVRCRGRIHDDSATAGTRPVVAVGPGLGIVLAEGHSYAAVLTSRVKSVAGAHLVASADFQSLLSGKRTGAIGTLYGGAIDKVQAALSGALASDGATIVAIAPFTTQSISSEMLKLRESLEAMPVPKLAWDATSMAPMGAMKFAAPVQNALPAGFTASLDDWLGVAPKLGSGADDPDWITTGVLPHDQIAAIGSAVFQAANFLTHAGADYTALDYATFARDASGNIIPDPAKPTQPIWVTFAIPKTPMPAGGYPCVIVGHGLPGQRGDELMQLANALTAKGWIVAAIDMLTNGARANDPKFRQDTVTFWQNAPGAKYAGPDGFSDRLDSSGNPSPTGTQGPGNIDMLGGGLNFGAIRDQSREVEIDYSQLARVLASDPDLSPLQTGTTAPKIDGTKLAYIGGSWGGSTGAVAAAFEPKIRTWVINVPLAQIFGANSASAAGTQSAAKQALVLGFGITGQFVNDTNPITAIGQTIVDAWDPLTFAQLLVAHPATIAGSPLAPRNVLGIEVLYDETNGNDGTEAWARAVGMGLAAPNVGPNAGITTPDEIRDPTKVPDRIPLPDVQPDGSQLIHDTPVAGATAVLVQAAPGSHYANLLQSTGQRNYTLPVTALTAPLSKPYTIRQSYLEQQAMVTRFIADAFAGGAPNVTGFKPPVRDIDDDGSPDATDPDPNDPTVK